MDGEGLPQWVTIIGSAVGVMIAAFVTRMGWKSGGGDKPATEKTLQVEGALVDSSSVKLLASAVEAINFTLLETRLKGEGGIKDRADTLLRITIALESISAGIKQWNDFHEQEEEEREKREKDRIERENEQLKRDLEEAKRRQREGAQHGSSTSSSLSFDNKG